MDEDEYFDPDDCYEQDDPKNMAMRMEQENG